MAKEINPTQESTKVGAATQKIDTKCLGQIILDVKTVADELNENDSSQQLQEISSRLSNFKVTIGFVGLTNSGKSTTLNSLMGFGFLPYSFQRQSVCPVCIKHDSQPEDPKCPGKLYGLTKTDNREIHLASGVVSIQQSILEMNKADRDRENTKYDEFILHAPIVCLSESSREITKFDLYDTPGLSEPKGSVAMACAKNSLRASAAIVLVIGADTVSNEGLTNLVQTIRKDHPNIMQDKNRMCVLVNKYDMCYEEDDDWDPKELITEIAKQIGVPPEQIEYFSAKSAFTSREWRRAPSSVTNKTYRKGYSILAGLSKPPVDINSLVEFSPENVKKLTEVLETFSRIREVETRLLKNLFNNDLQILLKSCVNDSYREIESIEDAASKKDEGLKKELLHFQGLIKKINSFLNEQCKTAISEYLEGIQHNLNKNVTSNASALKEKIRSEARRAVSGLHGQFDGHEYLNTRVRNARDQVIGSAKRDIKKLWDSSIQEARDKLRSQLKILLSKFKQDIINTHLTDHLNFEGVNPCRLVERLSFSSQPDLNSLPCISNPPGMSVIISRNVTRYRNEDRVKTIPGRPIFFGIFGREDDIEVPYTKVVDYTVTVYEVAVENFLGAFEPVASESANFIIKDLERNIKEQTEKLSQIFLNELQQIAELSLRPLNDSADSISKQEQDVSAKVKVLDNKREELRSALRQLLSQQGLSQVSSLTGDTELTAPTQSSTDSPAHSTEDPSQSTTH